MVVLAVDDEHAEQDRVDRGGRDDPGTGNCNDGNRRDNSPNGAGEVGPGTPYLGKVSCLQGLLPVRGVPLPIR